jgi:outer membrane protein OmpA-like peptidoglycan-associated protein
MDDEERDPTHRRGNTANYINADGENGPDRMTEYKCLPYMQAGVGVEFNLNRTLALGVNATYSYFTKDYIDGRGFSGKASHASKNNDGIFDVTLNLRIKFEPQSKNHVRNISSFETWEKKAEQKPCHDTVIIRHDSIIVRETFQQKEKELEQYYYVYFANNKADIDDKGLITIQQVAERLQEDTTLYAIVTGYCDNTGSNSLNYALGDRRADNVVDELAQEHGIDMERMHGGGMGKVIGRRSTASYGPNRRAAIRLVDKETFERMKYNLDDQKANRPEAEKTVPLTESSRQEKVNVYKERMSEEVTTEKSTTLSKLARQYYDNTYCWVYIYIANKEKISNPNALLPGTTLIIPELTEKEMQITKDESLVLFSNARQQK